MQRVPGYICLPGAARRVRSSNKKNIFSKSIRATDLILFLKTFTISQLHLTRCMCIEIFNISHRSQQSEVYDAHFLLI
jgi:hypothetical protein